MNWRNNPLVMVGAAVVILVMIPLLWYLLKPSNPIAESPVVMKCADSGCDFEEVQPLEKWAKKWAVQVPRGTNDKPGPEPLTYAHKCPKCGKNSVFPALVCGNPACGKRYVPNSLARRVTPTLKVAPDAECPFCHFSPTVSGPDMPPPGEAPK
ncbi:MAG: hypothetical protein V1809_05175 [Planctomycetota bacterium]